MTEINEQLLSELVDRLLAGEEIDTDGLDDRHLAGLIEIASKLASGSPEPDSPFAAALDRRLARLRAANSETKDVAAARYSWLPGWFSWRRAAAVAATLLLGLGIAGMALTVVSGNSPFKEQDRVAVSPDDYRQAGAEGKQTTAELPGPAAGTDYAAPSDWERESAGAVPDSNQAAQELRRVIQTADYKIEVPVGDFHDSYQEIGDIAAKYGGYVTSSDSSVSGENDDQLKQGVITFRIANIGDNFNLAQNEIEGLGKVVTKQVSGEDVSQEFIDLQSRLRNAEAQQASLLALLEKAGTVDEILLVQSRLDEVQLEIEQLKGRIEYMESMTDYATITVDLFQEDVEDANKGREDEGIAWGFVEAVEYAGWLAVQTVNFVIMALGVIIPVLAITTLLVLAVYRFVRWHRGRV